MNIILLLTSVVFINNPMPDTTKFQVCKIKTNDLFYNCPLSLDEAIYRGIDYYNIYSSTNGNLALVNLKYDEAYKFCGNIGYRLPTTDESLKLYKNVGKLSNNTSWGGNAYYWTSDNYGEKNKYVVNLDNGKTDFSGRKIAFPVICVSKTN